MNGSALVACPLCGLVHELPPLEVGDLMECSRCSHQLARKTAGSFHLSAAFALCALLLYAPANIFPILRMSMYGSISENTILSGVVRFYKDGDYFVAIVVFLASFLIPLLKIMGLFFLIISSKFKFKGAIAFRAHLYTLIEILGRWAMLDVFALAVLVSLVKLERIATVIPGKGAAAFVCVVIFTVLASASYDPQLIWEENHPNE